MRKIFFATIFLAAILGLSCTERIDIDVDSSFERVVIYGTITNQAKAHSIMITKSGDYFKNNATVGISDAIVSIDNGLSKVILTENKNNKGEYLTEPSYKGEINKTYTLTAIVNVNGKIKTYTAQSYMNTPTLMDSIQVKRNDDFKGWNLLLYAYEPPTEDFYVFNAYKNNVLISDTITEPGITDDVLVNGRYSYGFPAYLLNENKPDEKLVKGDIMSLEICNVSKEYVYFLFDLQQETLPKTPLFSGPSANIRTNIVGENAFGFFCAYSSSKATAVYNGN